MCTELANWDATLSNAQGIDAWLAGWIVSAAEDPASVKATIVERESRGIVVELTDSEGIASGGVILFSTEGSIHVLGAVDRANEPHTKRRTVDEMIVARGIALRRKRCSKRWETFGKCCVGVLVLLAIFLLRWVLG